MQVQKTVDPCYVQIAYLRIHHLAKIVLESQNQFLKYLCSCSQILSCLILSKG